MDKNEIDDVIQQFMHPTVYTRVRPLFLVAEELPAKEHIGDIIDAVWVHWDDENGSEFSYITKFAVQGKILERNYYTSEEVAPFKGRLALPSRDNFKKMISHRAIKQEIEEVNAKRNALARFIQKDFKRLGEVLNEGKTVSFFKKGQGKWTDPFNEISIEVPYQIVETQGRVLSDGEYRLKHPKTGVVKKYCVENDFYAYIVGARAEIAGLQVKDESYKIKVRALKDEARKIFASIEWLSLNDPRVKSIKEKLPRHPFEDYFNYVKKGDERKLYAPEHLIKALELIITEHMPKFKGPMGVEYIPIDNLLYLLHEIIPRVEAQLALEVCDTIYEPSALLLGFEGQRERPPKFLVSVSQVAYAYEKFPSFIEVCETYLSKG